MVTESLSTNRPAHADLQYFNTLAATELHQHGLNNFDDFWNQPVDFVEPVNYRRGGWSATSRVEVTPGLTIFIKRQENQLRRSLTFPLKALTYQFELHTIQKFNRYGLPGPVLCCAGFRKQPYLAQGLLVTIAIKTQCLDDLRSQSVDWPLWYGCLNQLGKTMLKMHEHRISHGALIPRHIFLDRMTSTISLIDLERSRRRFSSATAIRKDMTQLIRRCNWLPEEALDAITNPYMPRYEKQVRELKSKYYRGEIETNTVELLAGA